MARAEQGELEGIRPKRIQAIEKAAIAWRDAKAEHAETKSDVDRAEGKLLEAMAKAGTKTYCVDGFLIVVEGKEKVRAKIDKKLKRNQDDGEEAAE